jgi:hypothetical protein
MDPGVNEEQAADPVRQRQRGHPGPVLGRQSLQVELAQEPPGCLPADGEAVGLDGVGPAVVKLELRLGPVGRAVHQHRLVVPL